jgi:putative transport protein
VIEILTDNPLLVLFLVIAIGALFGSIRAWGVALGPAAALFTGLALGAIDDGISGAPALPTLQTLGLVLFTYTVGLAAGPTFLAGMRRGGAVAGSAAIGLVGFLAALVTLVGLALDLDTGSRAGLFAGSTTNTPALQAAIDALAGRPEVSDPVVAYSLAYPSAVVMMILVLVVMLRDRPSHPPSPRAALLTDQQPARSWTVRITRPDLPPLGELRHFEGSALAFSRYERDGVVDVATSDIRLQPGDLVVVVGPAPTVEAFSAWAGERSDRHLALDRHTLDFRRMVVSNRALAGSRIGDLDLTARYGAVITRVRRGDTDLVATDQLALQLGDRVRVVAPSNRLPAIAKVLGDSDRSLAEVDAVGFAAGIGLGVALGLVTIPMPGGGDLALGTGGGPLIAGIVLGAVTRTGPVTWQLPQAANLTLRQLGVLMFLASAGLRSGSTFADAVFTSAGAELAAAGLVLSSTFAVVVAVVMRLLLQRDPIESAGLLSGVETQPAAYAFANDRTHGNDRVAAAYALVLPVGIIAKIVIVQFLV